MTTIYVKGEYLGTVITNRSLSVNEVMYALGYEPFDWAGHDGEEHGDYINDEGNEIYLDDITLEA